MLAPTPVQRWTTEQQLKPPRTTTQTRGCCVQGNPARPCWITRRAVLGHLQVEDLRMNLCAMNVHARRASIHLLLSAVNPTATHAKTQVCSHSSFPPGGASWHCRRRPQGAPAAMTYRRRTATQQRGDAMRARSPRRVCVGCLVRDQQVGTRDRSADQLLFATPTLTRARPGHSLVVRLRVKTSASSRC